MNDNEKWSGRSAEASDCRNESRRGKARQQLIGRNTNAQETIGKRKGRTPINSRFTWRSNSKLNLRENEAHSQVD